MSEETTVQYNEDWTEYYQYLEELRQSGVTNMWGAAPYLDAAFDLERGKREAKEILCDWMKNYQALVDDGVIERN